MTMFYCEQLSPTGRWVSTLWADRPTAKTPSGRRIQIRNVQELTANQEGMSLKALDRVFNPDNFKREYYSLLINWCDGDVVEQGDFSWAGWADSPEDAEAQARNAMNTMDVQASLPDVDEEDDEEPEPREFGSVTMLVEGYNVWAAERIILLPNLDQRVMDLIRPPEVL